MNLMRSFLVCTLYVICMPIFGQTPVYDDLVFDEEEGKTYKPAGKNYVFLRSKKGTGGMPTTSSGDSIKKMNISDIILVFTETNEAAAETREEGNKERWENLLATYPQFFQFNTNYKNVCQCVMGGDAEVLKQTQGFYVYIKKEEPKAVEMKVEPKVAKTEEKKETKKEEAKKEEKKESKKEEKKEEAAVVKNEKKVKEKKEEKKEEEKKEEEETSTAVEGAEETVTVEVKAKKTGYKKPKVSKDKKACRPPCYGYGDEDLHTFFKEQIVLTKKQRRAIKGSLSIVKLSLNFDGSVKKAMVNGTNAQLNELVTIALKGMDLWNPAVKGGVTVKSEVKITLKYDKGTKAVKPFEILITPRPNPKCTECKTDQEIFGKE
ncbi:MAG: hypothetical protein H0U95_14065 [Bacteroidetes bacterium]|nr:hypothetical protein [Bacteroidota bacterium]